MAVQEQTPLREYTANGVTTSFALGFDCEETNHLIVTIDDVEVLPTDWYLSGSNVVFWTAPGNGKLIKLQRNTPFNRLADYQSYNNSFRPPAINKEFDRIWWKLQELGVADWILHNRIDALKAYVDDRDDELRAYLLEEIRKQGVALDQLDEYYNYLMQRLAQIAVDKGWEASFVVSAGGDNQQEINDRGGSYWREKPLGYDINSRVMLENGDIVRSTVAGNTVDPNVDMTGWSYTGELRLSNFCSPSDSDIVKSRAFKSASTYCRRNKRTLIIDIDTTIIFSEFESDLVTTTFGKYFPACGLVGESASLNFKGGQFGLLLPPENSVLRNLSGTTEGWFNTPDASVIYQAIFLSNGVGSSEYKNISYKHITTVSDGTQRGGYVICDQNSVDVFADNISGESYLCPLVAMDGQTANIGSVYAKNVETGCYVVRFNNTKVDYVNLLNTKQQASTWTGKTAPQPKHYNGLDGLLVEDGGIVHVGTVDSTWATERGVYLIGSELHIKSARIVNSSGAKLVGSTSNIAKRAFANNITAELTDEFLASDLRALPCCFETYLCDEAHLTGESGCISTSASNFWRCVAAISKYTDHYVKRVTVGPDCFGTGIGTVVYIAMDSRTSGQSLVCDKVAVLGGEYTFNNQNQRGALLSFREIEASEAAKLTYALNKVVLKDPVLNMINLDSAVRPNWALDARWLASAYISNIETDSPFRWHYPNVTPGLNTVIETHNFRLLNLLNSMVVRNSLSIFDLKHGSDITIVETNPDREVVSETKVVMPETARINTAPCVISVSGMGYWQLGGALTGTIEMTSNAGYSVIQVVDGVKTTLLGTPPLEITADANNLQIRGDLASAIKYNAKIITV